MYLRFRLKTDDSVRGDGAYVDNVDLGCEASANTYAFLDGTSFSTPFVSGAAALVWARRPLDSVAEVRSALLDRAHVLPGVEREGRERRAARRGCGRQPLTEI